MRQIIILIIFPLFLVNGQLLADTSNIEQQTLKMNIPRFEYHMYKFGYHIISDQVYYVPEQSGYEEILIEENVTDFEILDIYYAKNKQFVYFRGKKLDGIAPQSFVIIDYTRDKNNIYYYEQNMEGVDLKTFNLINAEEAEDKNYYYEYGKRID